MLTLLIGNFGAHNIGDECILHTALQKYPDAIVMTADPAWTKSFLERPDLRTVKPFPAGIRSTIQSWLSPSQRNQYKTLAPQIDQIIFPGGGLFAIKTRACEIWHQYIQTCHQHFPNVPIHLQSQGVDQGLPDTGKRLTKEALSSITTLSVRDEASAQAVQDLGLPRPPVVPDPVQNLETTPSDTQANIVLLNGVRKIDQELYSRIKKLYKGNEVHYLPMSPQDQAHLPPHFDGKIITPQTLPETIKIFSQASAAIGERLHFLTLAARLTRNEQTFLLREPYSEKVESFAREMGIKIFFDRKINV